MKPTEVLVTEHKAVLVALQILEKVAVSLAAGTADAPDHLGQLIDFFRGFVDRCHHGKEEDVLFPELEKRGVPREGGPIGVMLAEHDSGRRHIREMANGLARLQSGDGNAVRGIRENVSGYKDLLRGHIDKEDNILYPMADQLLSEIDAAKMIERFAEIERDRVGVGKHEAYHDMLHRLKEIYRI
jgi:hemerythrin-like domain-containing protein